jgi:hypothetical protein
MRIITGWLILAASAVAQVPEYLPLQVGNQWVYRASPGDPQVLAVSRQETVNGNTYFVLKGFGQESWLRYVSDGVLVNYDRESRTEQPYLNFTAREGATFPTTAHPCNTTAVIETKSFKGSFPLGEFSTIAQVRYGGNLCADAGLTADYFLPYIGLIRRTETSFTGPRSYELTYARINGTVMVSTNETGFSLSTDKAVYLSATRDIPVAAARMTLRHTDETSPLILEFSSGQEVDYILTDSTGKTIWKWSDGRGFTQALHNLRVAREHNWATEIPLKGADGNVLPGGTYRLEGLITTRSEGRATERKSLLRSPKSGRRTPSRRAVI